MKLSAHLSVLMVAEDNVSQKNISSWKYSSNRRNTATAYKNRVMFCKVSIGIWESMSGIGIGISIEIQI